MSNCVDSFFESDKSDIDYHENTKSAPAYDTEQLNTRRCEDCGSLNHCEC